MKNIYNILFFTFLLTFLACNKTEDKYRNVDTKFKLKAYSIFEHDKGQIIRMSADDSCIYVSNAPDYKIFVYNIKGTLIKTIGKKGTAPWEFGTIWSFEKDRNGKSYWVHDYPKQLVKKYSVSNDSMILYKQLKTINNIQYLKDGKFLVPRVLDKNGDFLMSIFNAEKDCFEKDYDLTVLSGINPEMKNQDFIFQGWFCKNSNNDVIYACSCAGIFFYYNNLSDSVRIYKDIRNLPIPKTSFSNNELLLSPEQTVSLSATVDQSKFYILSIGDATKNPFKCKSFYIDIYELKNGKYIKSVNIPLCNGEEIPISITKTKNYMIIGYINGTIGVYDFKEI